MVLGWGRVMIYGNGFNVVSQGQKVEGMKRIDN